MINIEETIKQYGYNPDTLSKHSHKLVIANCDYCNILYSLSFGRVNKILEGKVPKICCLKCKSAKCKETASLIDYKVIRSKIDKTNIAKYGYKTKLQDPKIIQKMEENNIEKYGTKYHIASKEVQEKIKNTMLEKYGETCIFKTESFKAKVKKDNLEKYGVPLNSQLHLTPEIINKLNDKDWLIEQHHKQNKTLTEISKLLGLSGSTKTISDAMHRHGIEIKKFIVSTYEKEILNYLQEIYKGEIISSCRTILKSNKELDIYIPELKLAIELNGLYWHSEKYIKDINKHQNKQVECESKGIKLITIFDDEWLNKTNLIKTKLEHILGKSKNKIFARKCSIIKEKNKEFIETNHIQGYVGSEVQYNLSINGEIVAAMSFGKPRFTNKYEWELLRYCTKGSIVGGASKLFAQFIKDYNPKSLISYCNLRWGTGKMYTTLGFKYSHTTSPNYYWVKDGIKYNRYNFTKSNLIQQGFDPAQSEYKIMTDRGYTKLYDCGNKVFIWEKS